MAKRWRLEVSSIDPGGPRRTVDVVADWSRQGESEHLTGADSIHLTEAGQQRFAEMVMASTERCLAST